MNPEQETQLAAIKAWFVEEMDRKYRAGAAEHAAEHEGVLMNVPLLKVIDHALEEVVDLWAYLQTVREKVEKGERG